MEILIYCPLFSNRLDYILNYVFEERLGIHFLLSHDLKEYEHFEGAKLAYSPQPIPGVSNQILSDRLLFSQGISLIQPNFSNENGQAKCFLNDDQFLGFDVFAAIFYFISRYEEYLPFSKDQHGRFEAASSYAARYDILQLPIVDQWIMLLRNQIQNLFPEIQLKKEQFEVVPTIDIDQAFAIKHKGPLRFISQCLRAIRKGDFSKIENLFAIRFGHRADPFNVFERFHALHRRLNLNPIYFILFARNLSVYDRNIGYRNLAFRKLLRSISKEARIGIHPSYASRSNTKTIEAEIHHLGVVISQKIDSSRQHFLKLRLPYTYKALISIGIEHEYSMGFASAIGFRAGTSRPFRFYDLKHEQVSFLQVHPFCLMDTTFNTYLKLKPEQALQQIKIMIEEIKKVNGIFVPLWHNESLSGYEEWKGWENVYEQMLEAALQQNNNL
jgi:hypothetical protein